MIKKLIYISILLLFVYACKKVSNNPIILGGNNYDAVKQIIKDNNSYILTGLTTSYGIGGIDGLFMCLNKNLKLKKQSFFGGRNDDRFNAIIKNLNGYLMVGSTTSYGAGNGDIYIVGVDKKGKYTFSKTFGGTLLDEGVSICKTSDNNFIILGNSISFNDKKNFDLYLIKIDSQGNCIWARTEGGEGNEIGSRIIAVDDGYLIVGSSNSKNFRLPDIYLLKINEAGNKIFEQFFGSIYSENAHDIIKSKTSDTYYIVGDIGTKDNLTDIYVLKLDSNAHIIWEKIIGGKGIDSGTAIIECENNDLIVLGTTWSKGNGMSDILIIMLDEHGLIKWETVYGGSKDEYAANIVKSFKNNYLISGWTASFGKGEYNIILFEINEKGIILQ